MADNIEEHITNGLVKISQALKSGDWEQFARQGITPTQKQAVIFLRDQKKIAVEVSLSDLARHLAVTPATASDIVVKLVEKGLIQKAGADDDKRRIILTLSKTGERLSREMTSGSAFLINAIKELTDEEKAVFLTSLIKMIKSLQDQGKISFVRMCLSCSYFRPNHARDAKKPHFCAYMNAPLAHEQLRADCEEFNPAEPEQVSGAWKKFIKK